MREEKGEEGRPERRGRRAGAWREEERETEGWSMEEEDGGLERGEKRTERNEG